MDSSVFLPYWAEDEIDQNEHGYFLLKRINKDDEGDKDQKPGDVLLLNSTEVVLKLLNPGKDMNSILVEDGRKDMTSCDGDGMESSPVDSKEEKDDDEPQTHEPTESPPPSEEDYESYQSLQRVLDLSSRIQAAIHDIQQCKNKVKPNNGTGNDSKQNNGDEAQAECLDQQDSDMDDDADESSEASQEETMNQNRTLDEEEDDEEDDDKTHEKETEMVRMVRTLNSIRALFPHLIPILNHPKKSDKKLKIKGVAYKKRRRRAMCWILGKYAFDTTSLHWSKITHRDIILVLKGYIPPILAEMVSSDPLGPLEFWQKQWIPELKKRMTPKIARPLDVLLESNASNEEESSSILKNAQKCDQDLFTTEIDKTTFETRRKYRQCIDNLRDHLLRSLKKRFPKARLTMYGSCLSNLSLGGSDVDLSLWIPEAQALREKRSDMDADKYQREMKKLVYKVFHVLSNRDGFQGMQPITRARVPVVKGTKLRAGNPHTSDGSIDFDICFLNDIAVTNSNLLREYSLVDARVREFMLQVKRFCRHHGVNSSPNGTISSYAWNIMCIFYLQCIDFIPNLQDPALMEKVKLKPNPKGNYWHLVDGLETFYLKWKDVEKVWKRPAIFDSTTVSLLLYGFFEFYNHRFAYGFHTISIRQGSMTLSKLYRRASPKNPKLGWRVSAFSIEDPFENYESHRPHDLGSHSFNDDKIIRSLMDGEKHLQKLVMYGMTENPCGPWKRSTNGGEEQGAKKSGKVKKPKVDKRAPTRKKVQNGRRNQGEGNQRHGRNNINNAKGRKKAPQQKRKNAPTRGPKKSKEKNAANGNEGRNKKKLETDPNKE